MWKYIKKYLPLAILAALFMVGEVSMDLLQPRIMSRIMDEGVLGIGRGGTGSMELIWTLGLTMIFPVVGRGISGWQFSRVHAILTINSKKQREDRKIMPSWTKTVYEGGEGEITEKKSRFIATVCPVHSEAEALAFIEKIRKKYWDARHNCYAYILGENQNCMRSSDDGEPQGTAGHPMLDVLTGEQLYDVAVVVTRYFGGVLLGTGGLVRAYSRATQEGLKNSTLMEKKKGLLVFVETDYTGLGKLQYLTASRQIIVLDTLYEDCVKMKLLLEPDQKKAFYGEVMDATAGKAVWQEQEEVFYAKVNDRVLTGDDLYLSED